MATKAQLEAEIWWREEFVPPGLRALAISLRIFFNVGPESVGSKGDYNHLRGYHRSWAWIKNSHWCTNRTYSVSRTPGDRNPGNSNWVTGLDVGGMSATALHAMCRRVDAAVRAGKLNKVTEWYGTFDGVHVVGYDNISNVSATSDSSHLSHLHLSFDRGRADEEHDDVLAILTGVNDMEQSDKLTGTTGFPGRTISQLYADLSNFRDWWYTSGAGVNQPPPGSRAAQLLADIAELKARPIATLTPADQAAIAALVSNQLRAVIRDELDRTRLSGA